MRRALQFATVAVITCYGGDHSVCEDYSYVCKQEHPWAKAYLPENLKRLVITQSDADKLTKIIHVRLGIEAIEQTHKGFSTNMVESFNSSVRKSCPKSLTCSKNFRPRVLTSVARHNLGLDVTASTCFTTATNTELPKTVGRALQSEQKEITNEKRYRALSLSKKRRIQIKRRRFQSSRQFAKASTKKGKNYEKIIIRVIVIENCQTSSFK